MRKIGQSAPAPMEYITLIVLPRQGLVKAPKWSKLSLWEQHLMITMLTQEADPVYRRTE